MRFQTLLLSVVLPGAALTATAGCAGTRPAPEPGAADVVATLSPDDPAPFDLAVGEAVRVGAHTVRFLDVLEDSRCPANVTCVWQGRAVVRVQIDGGETKAIAIPHGLPSADPPSQLVLGERSLAALNLLPYPGTPEAAEFPVKRLRLAVR
ncbi:MAG: hypothetical protein ACK41D_12320 [Rubricoccaceae bacterium]